MTRAKLLLSRISPALQGYALAIVSFAVALGLNLFLFSHDIRAVQFPIFIIGISIAVWYGGLGPGIFALILATLAFNYYFTEPYFSFYITRAELPYYATFVIFALLVTWFATIRRRVERRLLQSQYELQREVAVRTQQASLLDLTHDPILVRDMEGVVSYWNRGAEELYGWTAPQAIGKRTQELLRTVFPIPVDQIKAELLRNGRWEGELTKTKADGATVVVSSRWSLQRNDQQPVVILESENDVTERKQKEDEIRRLNRELGEHSTRLEVANKELESFAYSVSHDLRAPLRHIAGYTELLQKTNASLMDDKGRRYMMMILDSAKRMGQLIDDLLAFSRIGRAERRETAINLEQLVREVQNEVRPETEGRNFKWKIGPLPDLYADRSMLKLALVNLISNAIKFTRTSPAPQIEIGCSEKREDGFVLFVKDNGVGFDMKYVDKLFGVFQRLHRTEEFEGTGIGLATVQRIIHRHGGHVWAEGQIGSGATFYFSLPTR